jgi:aminomethyltransferase
VVDKISSDILRETPLRGLHERLGGRMVPFAGYIMPVQYPLGILAEHRQVRTAAGLFDVSHMGQTSLVGAPFEAAAVALEGLTPGNIGGLRPGRMRYTVLLNEEGGIIDDLIVTRPIGDENRLDMVLNADRKDIDCDYLRGNLPAGIGIERHEERALLALQGPKAAAVLERHAPGAAALGFMASMPVEFDGLPSVISRSGYTGEDGFEISVANADAVAVAEALVAEADVEPIGLGARDSLRLEAGLCLYGHDLDEATSPVEADLGFTIAKRRREEGGFAGSSRILGELRDGPARVRIGLLLEGRAPAREGAEIQDTSGRTIGTITSGGFGPTTGVAVAMGYVESGAAAVGDIVSLQVRGRSLSATVSDMPFVPHRYFKKSG